MRKVCKIFLLLILFVITGCNATYEINIKNNKITENIKLVETNFELLDKVNDTGWSMRTSFDSLIENDEFSKNSYKISRIDTNTENGIKYKNSYSVNSIETNTRINECYKGAKIEVKADSIYIETGNDFDCYEYYENFDTLTVKIKSNHEVIKHNAHEVDGNTYIWNITKDSDKNIIFEFNRKYKVSMLIYIGIAISIIIIIVILLLILKRKNKSNNKF